MEEEEKLPNEEQTEYKTPWQITKERWYDKIPLTVKQLDIIIWLCYAAMAILVIRILMDAGIL